jgi:antirestriction protein ArdC
MFVEPLEAVDRFIAATKTDIRIGDANRASPKKGD